MLNRLKQALTFGLGVAVMSKEKAEEVVKELVQRGEISREEGHSLVEEVVKQSEDDQLKKIMPRPQGGKAANDRWEDLAERVEVLELKLDRLIDELEDRLEEIEERMGAAQPLV